jgi:uncharacterized membrane protein
MSFCPACGAAAAGALCPKCGSGSAIRAGAGSTGTVLASAGLPENTAGALCYFGGIVTGILFLVIPPYNQNPRIKFHAFQAILFNLGWILGWFAMIPLGMLLPFGLSVALSLFNLLLWAGGLLLWLFLMWKAYQGQTLSLPLIGSIARQQVAN